MTTRRSFFQKALGAAGALSLTPLAAKAISEDVTDVLISINKLSPLEAASDEELWARAVEANFDNRRAVGQLSRACAQRWCLCSGRTRRAWQ